MESDSVKYTAVNSLSLIYINTSDGCERCRHMVMLNLQIATPSRWFLQVDENLNEILIDHAHCEKKAAGVAINLLFPKRR